MTRIPSIAGTPQVGVGNEENVVACRGSALGVAPPAGASGEGHAKLWASHRHKKCSTARQRTSSRVMSHPRDVEHATITSAVRLVGRLRRPFSQKKDKEKLSSFFSFMEPFYGIHKEPF